MANEENKIITPMDIHNKEFKRRGRNGYDRYEVDSFLDEIVNEYGDALDKNIDFKNQILNLNKNIASLKKQNNNLQAQVNDFKQHEAEINEVLIFVKKTASKVKNDAEKEAQKIINDAKQQAKTDTQYEIQQQKTLAADYKHLQKKVGQFRVNLQDLFKKQIISLNDDEWQHALDKYFNTPRYYPEDGSEPIDDADKVDLLADVDGDGTGEIGEPDHVDKEDLEDVESYQEVVKDNKKNTTKPLTTDSPNHEIINDKPKLKKDPSAPTIIFPDDYQDHN